MKYYCLFILIVLCFDETIRTAYIYGTTRLLHAPTAEMQKDKIIMIGGA